MEKETTMPMARYVQRRAHLRSLIAKAHPGESGCLLLCADFEPAKGLFEQQRSFFYLTGIQEPGVVLLCDAMGKETLFVPRYSIDRAQWMYVTVDHSTDPALLGVHHVQAMGEPTYGYALHYPPTRDVYQALLKKLGVYLADGKAIYVTADSLCAGAQQTAALYALFEEWLPGFKERSVDISAYVYQMRRHKDEHEIACMQHAIDVTIEAQRAVAGMIKPGLFEYQVRATVDYTFAYKANAVPAFPSIVATGVNTTVLHYTACDQVIKQDDLVVVDIGASHGLYAADITRTYPAAGRFTQRQKELYQLVLDAQTYIANLARPGMFLRNPKAQEKSLHHLAIQFFAKHGMEHFFCHGIGHYLGLDVHDVGTYATPLASGDVITIEPGLYVAAEALGIRIEDDYVITEQGATCLSAALPKKIDELEAFMVEARNA